MSERIDSWIAAYRRAWETNDPDDIRALFTESATYRTNPHAAPWSGREAIVAGWIAAADEPGDATFDWHLLAETDDLAFVQGVTTYRDDPDYDNLWIIRFGAAGDGADGDGADGDGAAARASEFTEWWVERPDSV